MKGGGSLRLPVSKSWMCWMLRMILRLCFTTQLLAFHAGMLYSSFSTSASQQGLEERVSRRVSVFEVERTGVLGIFHDGFERVFEEPRARYPSGVGGGEYTKTPPRFNPNFARRYQHPAE